MHCALFRMVGQLRFMLVWLVAVALLASAVSAAVEKTATSAEDLDRNRERSQRVRYTSSWAVEITEGGDKAADVVARRHGYRNLGKVANFDNIYHFALHDGERVPRDTPYTAKSSALLSESSVGFADQQYVRPVYKRSYTVPVDPRFREQWFLLNTGQHGSQYRNRDLNIEKVWIQGLTGCNVTIGVVDDGFDYVHPDLRSNYAPTISYDFVSGDPDPRNEQGDWHGTRCAGIVSAAKDGEACGIGVAYNSQFAGLRLLGAFTDLNEASSLTYANDVIDIYSNSWGPCDEGCVDGPMRLTELALRTGAERGRNGKGSIFVWANGNGGPRDDCGADGYSTSMYTISVGAVGVTGEASYYDEECSAKMATAYVTDDEGYSAVTTTAVAELCVYGFGGTSASCPMMSGAIALALEANPDLTWRDVMYLVVFTSNPNITTGGSYITNGAGIRVSRQFGFGVLDAEAMVARARHWTTVPPQLEHRRVPSTTSGRATRFRSAVISYTYTGSISYLEHVVANMTLETNGQAAQRGHIKLELTSPSGTRSTLLKYRVLDDRNAQYYRWPFMSVAFWGENPAGLWRLTIKSQNSGTDVNYSNLVFQFYGTSTTPTSVSRIPARCHSSCARGCAAAGAMYCDACVRLRNAYTMECINRCPAGYTQRNGYCYDRSQPEPVCDSKLLSLTSGSCVDAGYTGCCTEGKCDGTLTSSPFGLCHCDDICHSLGDCCNDIAEINCTQKVIGTPMPYVTLQSSADVSTQLVPITDDGASSVIRIPIPLPIGSSLHNAAYVGTNGYISFDKVFTDYTTFEFPGTGHVTLVAPFFSDIDTSKGTGTISYEIHTLRKSEALFTDINAIINDQMDTEFSGTWLLLAEWKNAPEFGRSQSITNTFQGIVITNFTTSFAVFIYKCNDLQYSASATIGFTSFDVLFANHRLSGYNAKNIACMNSGQNRWVNLVYKLTREDLQPTIPIDLHDECALDLHNCEQECIDLPTYFVCSCYDGYALERNGAHCFPYCHEDFTSEVGEFNTPSWPDYYPSDFDFYCDWRVDLSSTLENTSYIIVFRVDTSAYGMEEDCDEEYIEFFDGLSFNATNSLGRFCGSDPPSPIGTTGVQARVVFHSSEEHPESLSGVRVTYSLGLLENECEENNGGCEHTCVDASYSYTCECESGYSLNADGHSCDDIDECAENSHDCDQVCINILGSYNCSCTDSFAFDTNSRSCVPSCNKTYSALSGTFQSPGWPVSYPRLDFVCEWIINVEEEGDYIIRLMTDDFAYGLLGRGDCPTDYLAFYDGVASNARSLGKFCFLIAPADILTSSSQAKVVFQASSSPRPRSRVGAKVSYEAISLVNECLTDNGGCDQICEDTTVAFECRCGQGYTLNANGHSCDDVDECSTIANNCEQLCVNTNGSFHCDCEEGFALSSDGRTCRISCGGTYTDTTGSFHTPGWPEYYPLDFRCEWFINPTNTTKNTVVSLNVDQAHFGIQGRSPCPTDYLEFHDGNATDDRSLGKYCKFDKPDTLYTSSSQAFVVFHASPNPHLPSRVGAKVFYEVFELVNECDDNNGGCEESCVNTLTSFMCHCSDGYTLASDRFSCEDIDECLGSLFCDHVCVNTEGSFHCTCRESFRIATDGRSCVPVCGGHITIESGSGSGIDNDNSSNSGSISTPGWPEFYPSMDFTCEWTFEASNNSIIEFIFEDQFGIRGFQSCISDYVEIFDGYRNTGSSSLGKFCTLRVPESVSTSSHFATIVFQASSQSHSTAHVGANITYTTLKKVNECEVDNGGCEQTCVDLPKLYSCSCVSGYSLDTNRRECADIDECLGSHSDYCDDVCVNTEGSFHCTCRESFVIATDGRSCVPVCGGHITIESGSGSGIDNDNSSNSGSISTPGWPEFYPSSDFTCEWTFEASNNSIIEFIFEDRFGIRASQSCATDYVDIFDGYRNTGSSSLGKFCTLRVPESVSTSSNFATIVFQASSQSHSAAHVGANITYTTLEKVNECEIENGGCEQTCVDLPKLYSCTCVPGYSLDTNGRDCMDIDECSRGHSCEDSCVNTPGAFRCACDDDYFTVASDGRSCVLDCGGTYTGTNGTFSTPGWPDFYHSLDYRCEWFIDIQNHTDAAIDIAFNEPYGIRGRGQCPTDYVEVLDGVGDSAESLGKFCSHVTPDVVMTSSSRATVIFQASSNQHLDSRVGVSMTYTTVFFDVNECAIDNGGCGQVCEDTVRSYSCSCETGYTLDQDGRACNDIDECSHLSHGCEHVCVNTQGSYYCECRDGFALNSNNRTCSIDCGGRFTVTNGSFQSPGWPESYPQLDFRCVWTVEIIPTGQSVAFVFNETYFGIDGNSPCHRDYIEFFDTADSSGSSVGKYCSLVAPKPVVITSEGARIVFQGRVNPNRHPHYIGVKITYYVLEDECATDNGGCEETCTDTIPSYECGCREGYQLAADGHSCEDVDECTLGTHECTQLCINTIGLYTCDCQEYFSLAPNGKACLPECGEHFSLPNGTFHTPGWPDFYPELDFECEWTIDVDGAYLANDTRMALQFVFNESAYGFGPQSNCDRDHVNFYNGIDADAELSVKVCSNAVPLPFTVSSTQVKIVFRGSSMQHVEGQVGAKVAFYTIEQEYEPSPCSQSDVLGFDDVCRPVDCGGTLYAMAGVLHPPNWPNPSRDLMLCQWAIVLPDPERSIRIVVDEIDIVFSDSFGCFWNYVMVFDSSAVENAVPPLLGNRMCGTNPPSGDLVATGNVVNVWYQSRSPPNRGFAFSFFAV